MKNSLVVTLLFISNCGNLFAQSGMMTDLRDGKIYKTIQVDSLVWMAENLWLSKPVASQYIKDSIELKIMFQLGDLGDLYGDRWNIAERVCPNGWHLPSKEEFEKLLNAFEGKSRSTYKSLVNGNFDALTHGKFKQDWFWTSTSTRHMATVCSFPRLTHSVTFVKMKKDNLASIRCVKD